MSSAKAAAAKTTAANIAFAKKIAAAAKREAAATAAADLKASQEQQAQPPPHKNCRYCAICDIHLDEASYRSHIEGKKHQRVAKIMRFQNHLAAYEINVTNFPPSCSREDLVAFFAQYGDITNFEFNDHDTAQQQQSQRQPELIVRYSDHGPVEYLTRNRVYMKGKELTVRKQFAVNGGGGKRGGGGNGGNGSEKSKERHRNGGSTQTESSRMLSVLKTEKSFDEQINDLIQFLQDPVNVQQTKCENVLRDLSNALNGWFPCRLHKFGSTVTGLGFKNSDVDVYVDLIPERPYRYEESMEHLKSTKRILSRSPCFNNVIGIFGAKTPIVKCVHGMTGLQCDINFKNSLGLHNSELIKYLQTLDARVKPLMLVVKWWGKHLYQTGSSKITNYALTMMVVYFLQQKRVLPTIEFLQRGLQPKQGRGQHEWNCLFDKDRGRSFKIENADSLAKLLRGFFEYYSKFDYSLVVCPLTGSSYAKDCFARVENVPKGFERYRAKIKQATGNLLKLESSIVIMDPFELSHNITPSTTERILEEWKQACAMSLKCFEPDTDEVDAAAAAVTNADFNESTVLSKLFSIKLDTPKNNRKTEFEITLVADNELSYQLKAAMSTNTENLEETRLEWLQQTHNLVVEVMKDVLKLDTRTVPTSPERKTARTDEKQEVHDQNVEESVTYQCTSYVSMMRGRKKYKLVNRNMTALEHEKAISRGLLEKISRAGQEKPAKPMTDFTLTICKMLSKPTKVVLKFANSPEQRQSSEFTYIMEYCRRNLKKMLNRPLAASSNQTTSNNNIENKSSGVATPTKQISSPTTSANNTRRVTNTIAGNTVAANNAPAAVRNIVVTIPNDVVNLVHVTNRAQSNSNVQNVNVNQASGSGAAVRQGNSGQNRNQPRQSNQHRQQQQLMSQKRARIRHDVKPPGFEW